MSNRSDRRDHDVELADMIEPAPSQPIPAPVSAPAAQSDESDRPSNQYENVQPSPTELVVKEKPAPTNRTVRYALTRELQSTKII